MTKIYMLFFSLILSFALLNAQEYTSTQKKAEENKVNINATYFNEHIYFQKDITKTKFTVDEMQYLRNKKELKICVDPVWKPFEWIDKEGVYRGMGADYFKVFSEYVGIKTSLYKTKNWAQTISAIKAKKCDLLPMASITKERTEFVNFTKPYYKAPYVIATTNDKTFIEDISQKLDKTYAVVGGSAIIDDLKRMYPSIKIYEVEDIAKGLELVSKREVFGFINITTAISYHIQKENMLNIKITGKIPQGFKIAIAIRKDEPILRDIFQKAIDNLDATQKEAIKNRWLSMVVEERINYTLAYEVGAFALLLLVGLLYRHILLKRINSSLEDKVQAKTEELTKLNVGLEAKVRQRTEELEYHAYYDPLTHLPNRTLFYDRLEQSLESAKRTGEHVALFYIDIDRFKYINDSMGHDIGDSVLRMFAKRFEEKVRTEDTLSRLGGDEFTLIIRDIKTPEDAGKLAQTLFDSLDKPFEINDQLLYVSSSIGISIYPQDATNVQNLIKNADAAMYRAKEEGRNNFQFYSKEMTEIALARVVLQSSLRKAIDNREFVVYYQPQVDALKHEVIGVEALVRWNHPSEGLVSPAKFIPIAEETGLIVDIDRLVMQEAMKEVGLWHKEGFFNGTLSLNLAAKQLEDKACIETLDKQLKEHDFKAEWLELEITESDIMNKPEQSIKKLNKIHSRGVKVSIDDFGTGYSSLSYLKRFPIDKLKVDQSFIKDIPNDEEDSAIVKAIIALAKSLDISLIAEGVETKAQKSFLTENGCSNIQGYLYSKPLSAKEVKEFIKAFNHNV